MDIRLLTRLGIILPLLFLSFYLIGQNYIPTVEEGKKWSINRLDNPNGNDNYFPQITCDTIQRNNKIYNYIRCDFGACYYDNYIREDTLTQQVFYIDPGPNEEEQLFLDYSLEVGDSFPYLPSITVEVDSVYSSFIFGRIRKVIAFDTLLAFVEGVGSTFDGPLPGQEGFSWVNAVGEVACNEIFTDTEDINDPTFSVTIFPNPSQGLFQLELSKENWDNEYINIRIWSLLGELLFEDSMYETKGEINLTNLATQAVIIQVFSKEQHHSQMMLIQK